MTQRNYRFSGSEGPRSEAGTGACALDPREGGGTAEHPAFPLRCPLPFLDNLAEVQTLVEQVKEKTSNIQALAHGTVGQSLPVRVQPPGGGPGGSSSKAFLQMTILPLSPPPLSFQTPLKKLFPSIISIMWPLLFFEYEGNFIQVWGMGR